MADEVTVTEGVQNTPEVEVITDEELNRQLAPEVPDTITPPTATEPKKEVEPAKTENTPEEEEEITVKKSAWESAQKQIGDQRQFIQRRNTELGDLRRQFREHQAKLTTEIEEAEIIGNTREVAQKTFDLNKLIGQEEALIAHEKVENTKNLIANYAPDFEQYKDDIVEIVKEDAKKLGLNEFQTQDIINNFRHNPYHNDPAILVNLTMRANQMRKLKDMEAELSKLRAKPEQVVKNIEKAFKSSPSMTSSSGQATALNTLANSGQIEELSEAELDELLKKGDG
jgi:hypothetical protein